MIECLFSRLRVTVPAKICTVVLLASFCLFSGTAEAQTRLKLATTTSTYDTGLLDVLLPVFEKRYDVKVDVVSVGTGQALKLGENGDVDVVLVHARALEDAFVAAGFGVDRRDVMYNDFVVIGPKTDPARITGLKDAAKAFGRIAANATPFISRGDKSGTHQKEKEIWEKAKIVPAGTWYLEAGQGMGPVLRIADEKRAYCLTDRGTFLSMKEKLDLTVLVEKDPMLLNPYGIIAVSPKRWPHVRYDTALKLIAWITSPEGQQLIGSFTRYSAPLFVPSAKNQE